MSEIVTGVVTDIDVRQTNTGKSYADVYISAGRKTIKSTGPAEKMDMVQGECVAVEGEYQKPRFAGGDLEFYRLRKLSPANITEIFSKVFGSSKSEPVANGR